MEKLSKSLSTDFSDQTFLENSDGKPLRHNPDTIRLIKEMYASGLSMARIAGAINMSQSYVSIVINWYFPDVSKRYFLSSMEMKEDIEALLKSGETISSIALILGKKVGTVKQYIYRNIPGYGGTNNVDKKTINLVGDLYRSGKKIQRNKFGA
ncbi:helix-turn-helix transcriptional regulator [Nitrospirillum iridis]|uniref:DNA-binding CsgD family transcriptional regulator n=1 Tax=Nitrospirillum iridis TaxID=765888 RepID=A0A7X0B619_9PROT|nr:helix-turn-helix transcriptional regulator [Nitrospirillum iridis]MBB6255111.1 DNA-binding CsgD family transcriptional regulator [Nitrospirillum iridis]